MSKNFAAFIIYYALSFVGGWFFLDAGFLEVLVAPIVYPFGILGYALEFGWSYFVTLCITAFVWKMLRIILGSRRLSLPFSRKIVANKLASVATPILIFLVVLEMGRPVYVYTFTHLAARYDCVACLKFKKLVYGKSGLDVRAQGLLSQVYNGPGPSNNLADEACLNNALNALNYLEEQGVQRRRCKPDE